MPFIPVTYPASYSFLYPPIYPISFLFTTLQTLPLVPLPGVKAASTHFSEYTKFSIQLKSQVDLHGTASAAALPSGGCLFSDTICPEGGGQSLHFSLPLPDQYSDSALQTSAISPILLLAMLYFPLCQLLSLNERFVSYSLSFSPLLFL